MPWAWAMPHMMGGGTAAPRWTCSSVRGVAGSSVGRGMNRWCRTAGVAECSSAREPIRPGPDARIAGPMDLIRDLIEWVSQDVAGFVATLVPYLLLGLAGI